MIRSIRLALAALALSGLAGGAALAADPAPECPYRGEGGMPGGMMGGTPGGMMGGMPGGMMGGMRGGCPQGGCSMFGLDADADAVKVESLKDGVRITLTATDAKQVLRLQKRAEILRLQHELNSAE